MDDMKTYGPYALPPSWPRYTYGKGPVMPGDKFDGCMVAEVAVREGMASVFVDVDTGNGRKLIRFNLKPFETFDASRKVMSLKALKTEAELPPMEYCRKRNVKVRLGQEPRTAMALDLIDRAVGIVQAE